MCADNSPETVMLLTEQATSKAANAVGVVSDAEMALNICFGGRLSEHVRIGMDEGEVVTLLLGEARA